MIICRKKFVSFNISNIKLVFVFFKGKLNLKNVIEIIGENVEMLIKCIYVKC